MGKLKKSIKNATDQESGIDWEQLLVGYQNQTVDEVLINLMNKINVSENVEFDQVMLILKHYLIHKVDADKYLDHFLHHNESAYVKMLINRFTTNNHSPNIQWMISELFKILSSIFTKEQAGKLLIVPEFQQLILVRIFDTDLLNKLNISISTGLTQTETITLANLFDTISNLCEIKNELINFVNINHIEWLQKALISLNHIHYKDLISSIARIFHLISENVSSMPSESKLHETLVDLFLNKNFFKASIEALTTNSMTPDNQSQIMNNLCAKLYMIGALVNLVLTYSKFETEFHLKKSEFLVKLMEDYSNLIEIALSVRLNNSKSNEINNNENDECLDDKDSKKLVKYIEESVDCKFLSLEIIKSITSFFVSDTGKNIFDEVEVEEEIWEECDSDEEINENNINNEMDVEMDFPESDQINECPDSKDVNEFKNIIKKIKLMKLLIDTILNDDENMYQETNRIEHIHDSINFVKVESINVYLLILKSFYSKKIIAENSSDDEISVEHIISLLEYVRINFKEENFTESITTFNDKLSLSMVELAYDLFMTFADNKLNLELKKKILTISKDIIYKYKGYNIDLTARLTKIICLIAIKERDTNLNQGKQIIQECGHFLLEIAEIMLELNNLSEIDMLRLNAEFIDSIIDLFGDENLMDIELSLNFNQKIQNLGNNFYSKYKKLDKKQKLFKEHGVIIKIVRDNLKTFIQYKIK